MYNVHVHASSLSLGCPGYLGGGLSAAALGYGVDYLAAFVVESIELSSIGHSPIEGFIDKLLDIAISLSIKVWCILYNLSPLALILVDVEYNRYRND